MKQIPGFENYSVTKDGQVWSNNPYKNRRKRWLKLSEDTRGYLRVDLPLNPCRYKHKLIHHLVLETYVGPRPPGKVCRHLDGNKLNNNLNNLCWGTYKQNSQDSKQHGTAISGETQGLSKLTWDDVDFIRWAYSFGIFSQRRLAKFFSVSQSQIWCVVNERTWRRSTC
jgi:hypothetical protein